MTPKPTLLLGYLLLLSSTLGCQKLCQPKASKPFSHLTDTQWRLVETNSQEPFYKGANKYNFAIVTFAMDANGKVNQVKNNDQYDNPVRIFTWAPSSDNGKSGTLTIKYSVPP